MKPVAIGVVAAALFLGGVAGGSTFHPTTARAVLADVPGATNPAVTQASVHSTICRPGYSTSVRPPVSVTSRIKTRLMVAHGYTDAPADWELDHLIPLSSGGNPTSLNNLWLQPIKRAHVDDLLEVKVWKDVCSGATTLAAGQQMMVTLKHTVG